MSSDTTAAPGPSAVSSLRKAFVFMRPYRRQMALATLP